MAEMEQYFDKFVRDEMAIESIAGLMGDTSTAIFHEEEKECPDRDKITRLDERLGYLGELRDKIYSGDIAVKEQCIKEYSRSCHEKYGAQSSGKTTGESGAAVMLKTKNIKNFE
jgi:hypothetical protein